MGTFWSAVWTIVFLIVFGYAVYLVYKGISGK